MTNGVTLITCTGGRPESLVRCEHYVARFDNPDKVKVQWLVVNDVDAYIPTRSADSYDLSLVHPRVAWTSGRNTLASNLLASIKWIKHDNILFLEDDDYYHADYMQRQLERLAKDEMVGEAVSWYYHVPTRCWREMANTHHASLCQTGIRSSMLPALKMLCSTTKPDFIDWGLWNTFARSQQRLVGGAPRVVGIKGMPGRPGIGIGHRPELGTGWKHDPDGSKLREWLGNDAETYLSAKLVPEHVQFSA